MGLSESDYGFILSLSVYNAVICIKSRVVVMLDSDYGPAGLERISD